MEKSSSGDYSEKVILWEWENDFDWWIPYEPPVGAYLETNFSAQRLKPLNDPVPLADAQESLSRYKIELSVSGDTADCAGFQRNSSTGNQRRVRRRLVARSKDVLWRWQGDSPDHVWHPYAYDISCQLEKMKKECDEEEAGSEMDLQTCFVNYPYTVDVNKCTQRRNSTGFVRSIRRDENVRFPQIDDDGQIVASALPSDISHCATAPAAVEGPSNAVVSVKESCTIFVEGSKLPDQSDDGVDEVENAADSQETEELALGTAATTPLSKNSFSVDEKLTEELRSPTTPSSPPATSSSFSSCTGSFFKKFRARAKMSMTPISSTLTSIDGSQQSASTAGEVDGGGGAAASGGNGKASLLCIQPEAGTLKLASSVTLNPVGCSTQPQPSASHSPVIASKSAPDSLQPSVTPATPPTPSTDLGSPDQTPSKSNEQTEGAVSQVPSPPQPGRRRKKKSRPYFATFTKAINYLPRTNSAVIEMTNMLLVPLSFQMVVTPAPIFYPPSTDPCYLLSVPGIPDPSRKAQKKLFKKKLLHTSVDDVLTKHTTDVPSATVKESFKETECGICMELMTTPSNYSDDDVEGAAANRLNKCKHAFHRACLVAMYQSGSLDASLQCPSCKAIHGEKKGVCPPGFMDYYLNPKHSVPGFEDSEGTIVIVYYIKDGVQGPEHPNPEMPYYATGFPRQCYLPNNAKGRMVLQLLIVAWERRLTFTIGVSATTGADNTVTWNEIHHKTEWGSNRTGHGYPDPNYLDNVLTELAIQGVTSDDILPPSTPIESISLNESDPAVRPKGKKSRV